MLESDIAKDASTEATILSKSLDDAHQVLRERSTSMPGHVIIEAIGIERHVQTHFHISYCFLYGILYHVVF